MGWVVGQETLLKDRQSSLVSPHPIRILFICCVYIIYSDNEITTVRGRPAICTLIGWFKNSRLYISLSVSMVSYHSLLADELTKLVMPEIEALGMSCSQTLNRRYTS